MAELKTKKNNTSVAKFIDSVPDDQRRKDAKILVKLFADVTGQKPVMWGTAIVGYGLYHYESERSSQKGDWPLSAFSPRQKNLTLYIMFGLTPADLNHLGSHTSSKACLYIKRLSDVNLAVLKQAILKSYRYMQ